VLLPDILEEDEIVTSLSPGAGSSETKRFDLETSHRVAEFTFIEWTGNDNTRWQKMFKDFYRLAEFDTNQSKELWLTDDAYVLKIPQKRIKHSQCHAQAQRFLGEFPNEVSYHQDSSRLLPHAGGRCQNKIVQSTTEALDKAEGVRASGAPGETRTPNPLLRRQMLYPVELRAQ